jgi:hypothetical protein
LRREGGVGAGSLETLVSLHTRTEERSELGLLNGRGC